MSTTFNPQQGHIIVQTRIWGPQGDRFVWLALDTGATSTMISTAIEFVPRLVINQIEALGQVRVNFSVIGHTLPPSATVDGVLGLDFLRGQELTIDFRGGIITLK